MSDEFDSGRELYDWQVALATEQAKNSLLVPREYLIYWRNPRGEVCSMPFTGTPAQRRSLMEAEGIDQLPFAFGYRMRSGWEVAGTDADLKLMLRTT